MSGVSMGTTGECCQLSILTPDKKVETKANPRPETLTLKPKPFQP